MSIRGNGGLRHTGRTWERDGFSGPIMVDADGAEYECFAGSVADFTNGRLDAWFSRPGGLVDQLVAELDSHDPHGHEAEADDGDD